MELEEAKKTWFSLAATIVLYINWIYLPAGKLLYFAGYIAILAWLYRLHKDDEKTPGTVLALSAILLANWPYLPAGDLVYLAGIGVIMSASTALLSSSHLDEVGDKTRRYGYVTLCFALNWWLFSKQRKSLEDTKENVSEFENTTWSSSTIIWFLGWILLALTIVCASLLVFAWWFITRLGKDLKKGWEELKQRHRGYLGRTETKA